MGYAAEYLISNFSDALSLFLLIIDAILYVIYCNLLVTLSQVRSFSAIFASSALTSSKEGFSIGIKSIFSA